jgi:hypothetical protein
MSTPDDNPYAAPQSELHSPRPLMQSVPLAQEVHQRQLFPELSTKQLRVVFDAFAGIRLMNALYDIIAMFLAIAILFLIIGYFGYFAFGHNPWLWEYKLMIASLVLLAAVLIGLNQQLSRWSEYSRWIGMLLEVSILVSLTILIVIFWQWSIYIFGILIGLIPIAALRSRWNYPVFYGEQRIAWEQVNQELQYRDQHQIP